MTGTNIQSDSSVILSPPPVFKRRKEEKGVTDTTHTQRWNISKINVTLIATKYEKRFRKTQQSGDNNSTSVLFF